MKARGVKVFAFDLPDVPAPSLLLSSLLVPLLLLPETKFLVNLAFLHLKAVRHGVGHVVVHTIDFGIRAFLLVCFRKPIRAAL
ncbi:MAG: hypothetical protein QOJ76_1612 [Acidobacteriota bacterium]|jgi:hypothetical protein|nr:hypothetical protein [Acidobacteriota bacterium]